MTEVNANVPTR